MQSKTSTMRLTKALGRSLMLSGCMLASVTPTNGQTADNGGAITAAELTQNGYPYPSDLVAGANHTQMANYAWRLFIASTQLTTATLQNGADRGIPSPSADFIDTGRNTSFGNPLVFESLYHRTEAFPYYSPPSSKPPTPIGTVPTYYTYYKNAIEDKVAFTVRDQNYVNLDETNQIGQNFLYFRESNAPDFPVLFMAKVNSLEVNYVWNKQPPSADSSFVFFDQTLEVKTAWRRVRDIKNSDPHNYHQAQATYYVGDEGGTPSIETDTFALIAIHIIQKTANYPYFIFTTFEHVDSVTRNGSGTIVDPAFQLTYQQLAYDPGVTNPTAVANGAYYVNAPEQPAATDNPETYSLPAAGSVSQGYITVVQPKTITEEVNDVNNQVAGLIQSLDSDSLWANYRLKGVQAVPTSSQDILDYYLANIVVESSQPGIQLFRGGANGGLPTPVNPNDPGGPQVFTNFRDSGISGNKAANISLDLVEGGPVPPPSYTMGGCQGCHGRAQQLGRDFSFLAQASGGVGKELDSVPSEDLTYAQKAAHNEKMSKTGNYDD